MFDRAKLINANVLEIDEKFRQFFRLKQLFADDVQACIHTCMKGTVGTVDAVSQMCMTIDIKYSSMASNRLLIHPSKIQWTCIWLHGHGHLENIDLQLSLFFPDLTFFLAVHDLSYS